MIKARHIVAGLVAGGLVFAAWKIHDAEQDEKARTRRKIRQRRKAKEEQAAKTGTD